jgi:hypothetical protein
MQIHSFFELKIAKNFRKLYIGVKKTTLYCKFPLFFSLKIAKILRKKKYWGKFLSPFDTLFIGNKAQRWGGGHYQNEESPGGSTKGGFGMLVIMALSKGLKVCKEPVRNLTKS